MTEPHAGETGSGPLEVVLQLRWSDQDLLGHVNNARIVTLMEEARVRWGRTIKDHPGFGGGLVVASLKVDYRRQVDYRPEMAVVIGVERIGNRSFTVRHTGFQDGRVVFEGTTVMVPLSADGLTSRPLTDAERAALQWYMVPAPA